MSVNTRIKQFIVLFILFLLALPLFVPPSRNVIEAPQGTEVAGFAWSDSVYSPNTTS